MTYHFSTEIRVRLPETDAMGIAFHGSFFTYFDVGRMDYLRNLGLTEANRPTKGFSNVVVHASCDFKSPARFDDPLVVHLVGHSHGGNVVLEALAIAEPSRRPLAAAE